MAYCSSLAEACRLAYQLPVDSGLSAASGIVATNPNSAECVELWIARYLDIKGTLANVGVTVGQAGASASSNTEANRLIAHVEALYVSADVNQAFAAQGSAKVTPNSADLRARADALMAKYTANVSILSALSATVDQSFRIKLSGSFVDDPDDWDTDQKQEMTFSRRWDF